MLFHYVFNIMKYIETFVLFIHITMNDVYNIFLLFKPAAILTTKLNRSGNSKD